MKSNGGSTEPTKKRTFLSAINQAKANKTTNPLADTQLTKHSEEFSPLGAANDNFPDKVISLY